MKSLGTPAVPLAPVFGVQLSRCQPQKDIIKTMIGHGCGGYQGMSRIEGCLGYGAQASGLRAVLWLCARRRFRVKGSGLGMSGAGAVKM